ETRALVDRIRQGRAWHLPETASAPTGPESRRAPLVGRSRELERLVATWATCRGGRSGVVIVEGDGGTGKTRLAEELAGRARLDGAVIAAVRAVEADRSDPWSGVLGIARAGLLDAPGIAAASPAILAGLRGSAPLAAPARAFSEALRVVADEQPVMLVVDDAHWLDRESLLALGAAARDLTRSRVLLLITAAPHERREELDQVRAHLGRELAGATVTLGPLDGDALHALARWGGRRAWAATRSPRRSTSWSGSAGSSPRRAAMASSPTSCATSWTVTWSWRASAGGSSRRPDGLPPPRPVPGASPATTAGPRTRSASP